ncbi:hypothetical protein RJT34_16158 [Clitoria ternatea]|uniref:Uncharacterized protein n=1 Tax=Clitoria ternatea TaxID=43366 RepID=A0AAN9J6P9_CLITE
MVVLCRKRVLFVQETCVKEMYHLYNGCYGWKKKELCRIADWLLGYHCRSLSVVLCSGWGFGVGWSLFLVWEDLLGVEIGGVVMWWRWGWSVKVRSWVVACGGDVVGWWCCAGEGGVV